MGLPMAAELVAAHIGADAVGIYAFPDDEVKCCALLATSGEDASPLERATVLRGDCWSAVRLAETATARIIVSDAGAADDLPEDFANLHRDKGLRSFVAVAVGPKGSPLGVLVLGKKLPGRFDDRNSLVWVNAAATGLLQHLRPRQVAQAARMLRSIDDAGDPVSAISALLQGGAEFMYKATNLTMGLRLAVLERDGPRADRSLLFEPDRAAAGPTPDPAAAPNGSSRGVLLQPGPMAGVTVREVPMANTLLRAAVSQKKARFIRDCVSYVQNCRLPVQDVFTSTSEVVTSLVVVPLLAGNDALGALYFTQDKFCDFGNIQDTLLGFVHCVTPTMHIKLFGHMDVLNGIMKEVAGSGLPGPRRAPSFRRPPSRAASFLNGGGSMADGGDGSTATEGDDDISGSIGTQDSYYGPGAAQLSRVTSRLATRAMLRSLQQQIRRGRRRSSMLTFQSDLVMHEQIGRGGYGSVFRGTWHCTPAAIKVMNARSSDSEAVSDAMEMAALSSLQHPNIVQVYCCLTDMVELKDPLPEDTSAICSVPAATSAPPAAVQQAGSGVAGRPRYRRAMPGEELDVPTYSIMIMEYCDKGTLKEAIKSGMFHRKLPNGAIGVDLAAVVNVLLDVAYSLQYIHHMNLLHSDIKLDNILLKTDFSRPSGVVPKLADFGLAKILKDKNPVINHAGAGTVTHLPPEMFMAGTRITTAVDIYAFGILMWELYTGQRPYAGLTKEAIIHRVAGSNSRPSFPGGAPPGYAGLARACWSPAPESRPPASDVIARLQLLAEELSV